MVSSQHTLTKDLFLLDLGKEDTHKLAHSTTTARKPFTFASVMEKLTQDFPVD